MFSKRFLSFAGIIFVMFVWGLSFLSIKVTVTVLGPMTLALSRFIIASGVLFIILKVKEPGARLKRRDVPLMVVSGVVGITVYFFFENNGVKMTTASTASIIISIIPALTVLFERIFYGSPITGLKFWAVTMSVVGVYLVVKDSGQLSFNSGYFRGNLYMLGAALAWVVYSLVTKPLDGKYSRLAITTYQTLFGTLAIIPFAILEKNLWNMVNSNIIINIFFLGIFCSALGYYLYVNALGELGVDISSLFINLIPVVTVVSSYFILDEKITPAQLMGGALIISAVYLADLVKWIQQGNKNQHASL